MEEKDLESKNCYTCKSSKPLLDFYPRKDSKDGFTGSCKNCTKNRTNNYYSLNKNKVKARTAIHGRKITKEKSDPWSARKERAKRRRLAQRKSCILHYSNGSNACACCGNTNYEFLAIDHINGGGNKHRKETGLPGGSRFAAWLIKQNYPSGYRVLCHNCNMALGSYGYCPHQTIGRQSGIEPE
jgi:hypothetical protein